MLERTSSYELSEWQAYEKANGPLGPQYVQATMASMHRQLMTIAWLLGAQFEENPAPEPFDWPMPSEIFLPPEESDEEGKGEPVGDGDALNAFFDEIEGK